MMLFDMSFSTVSHYILKFMAKYFLQQLLNLWQPYSEGVASHKTASNVDLLIFSHTHMAVYRVIREFWTLLYDKGHTLSGHGSIFF